MSAVALTTSKAFTVIASRSRQRGLSRLAYALAGAALMAGLTASTGYAQQAGPPAAQTTAPADKGATPPALPKPQSGADQVAARIGRLEEQFVDLQVAVGTLESLLKSKPRATIPQENTQAQGPAGAAAQGELGARVGTLETQISALTSQIQQLSQQLAALQAGGVGAHSQPLPPPSGASRPGRQGQLPGGSSEPALASTSGEPGAFGTTSVLPEPAPNADSEAAPEAEPEAEETTAEPEADETTAEPVLPADDAGAGTDQASQPQNLVAALPAADATSLYNQGYGDLLRRDYPSAEASFHQLVETYPSDRLAGDAQYWLAESYFVRGQYKNAADAFLKGYKTYQAGQKAPDSLLGLGMSLAALGQKQAACSSFAELGVKFAHAPENVREQTKSERRKAGC
jgi:tol-pal system protein YbgF